MYSGSQLFECLHDSKNFLFPLHPERMENWLFHQRMSKSAVYLPRALRKGRKLYDFLKDMDLVQYPWINRKAGVKHLQKFNLGTEVEIASTNNTSKYGIVIFAKLSRI